MENTSLRRNYAVVDIAVIIVSDDCFAAWIDHGKT